MGGELHAQMDRLIAEVAARSGASDRVLRTLSNVPRHRFVASADLAAAYRDEPLQIGSRQTISQPTVVAMMTEALQLEPHHRVLEIGTGSGYQTAVLAPLCRHVYSIERLRELGEAAASRLADLGINNVSLRIGDGHAGWPEHAPFDRILLTAAPATLPMPLLDQLDRGGILVGPIGPRHDQQLVAVTKDASGVIEQHRLGLVAFVPMVRDDDESRSPSGHGGVGLG